jgi:hypothetical protein
LLRINEKWIGGGPGQHATSAANRDLLCAWTGGDKTAFGWLSPSTSHHFQEKSAMRCEAPTLGDFLYRIALGGFHFGYFRYALRTIPQGKDLGAIDRKLIALYGVTSCRTKRLRQRRAGFASIQYVRFGHTFILMATEGEHSEFSKVRSFDVRRAPLHYRSYTVGYKGDRVSVRISKQVWKKVETYHLTYAIGDKEKIEQKLLSLPYYRFPGVTAQIKKLSSAINQRRKQAGLNLITPPLRQPQRFSRRSYQPGLVISK